uniref:SH3 domain-containing protein n=1 Tax=Knipowitschia caucasica TaxID=637954 RepID=A0AAV2KME7_KNICA
MAEARPEEEEEHMRESREQVVVRRQTASGSGGRPDRRKPEHRLSQGPLSSIRAAIKRTSNRSTSLSETPPRDRERDRERERDRRRPEITILSAEPISSWFPGAGFPPPPPPAAQIWGPSLAPAVLDIQPPPSYEEVIREKNQERVFVSAAEAPSSPQSSAVVTTTIATQTDTRRPPDTAAQVRRPLRPPKPPVPHCTTKFSKAEDTLDQSLSFIPNGDSAPSISTQTPIFPEPDQLDAGKQRPKPRPRSKINLQPIRDEVRVQTLVKLRDDGLKTLAARANANQQTSNQEATGGTYLQELLEAFSSDDWGFPEQRISSQSESEDESNQEVPNEDQEEDMATLRARIQAFEQMHDGNFEETQLEPPGPSLSQPKLPPRPSIAPRSRGSNVGQTTPPLPPRPTLDLRARAKTEACEDESACKTVKVGCPRPGVPSKPTAVIGRRSSAPNLLSNTTPSADSGPVPSRPSGPPRPALRKSTSTQNTVELSLPPRPTGVKLLPLRPPPIKSLPGRPPPPSLTKSPSSSSLQSEASVSTNHTQEPGQVPGPKPKKRPPLPPRPKPGHPLCNSYVKQEVLIDVDDPSPAPSETNSQSNSAPLIDSTVCLLDLDLEPEVKNQDRDQDPHQCQSKETLEELSQTQNIPLQSGDDQDEGQEPASKGSRRRVALFDYSAVEEDELTFSCGDVIALLDVIGAGRDWGRGQLHGRIGIFPLNFTQTVEPLPPAPPATGKTTTVETSAADSTEPPSSSQEPPSEEWAVAVFDFPGQTAGDLRFHKGALIRVLEHVDAEWRRGRVEDREGLYPAAFTQPAAKARPIRAQCSETKATALFDFSAENEDELTLKAGDVLTQVESVDEEWILGVVGHKRGIVPKNYISLLT